MTNKRIITINGSRTDAPWVGCINSVNYRIERGVQVEVPETVARFIEETERRKKIEATSFDNYTRLNGVRLA